MPFKDISYLELWQPFVQGSRIICAILIEGIMRKNSVKLFCIYRPVVMDKIHLQIFLI